MKSKENINVIDAQETTKILKEDKKWYDYLLDIYNPVIFQKIMFLTNHKELIIISRKDGIKRKCFADYSHVHTYIPLINIKEIVYKVHDIYKNIYIVTFLLSDKNFKFYTLNREIFKHINL